MFQHSAVITRIQRYCLNDGPGTRTTLFFKGCPLNCKWCHNPENISKSQEIIVSSYKCIGCGTCQMVCPNHLDSEKCLSCGKCAQSCPSGARELAGVEYTVNSLLKEIVCDIPFFEESGGGITFSGGEPLINAGFLLELLPYLKEKEIHVALDTCGYASTELFLQVTQQVDLVLFDLKAVTPQLHEVYTGVSNSLIIKNLSQFCELSGRQEEGADLWIRIPIIPGINDGAEEIEKMISLLGSLPSGSFSQINLLPYHRIGQDKYQRLGKEYTLTETPEPSKEQMEELRKRFISLGRPVFIGG